MLVPGGRDVVVTRHVAHDKKPRYNVTVDTAELDDLTDDEAAALLYQLLSLLPNVELATKNQLHALRHPRDVTVLSYRAEGGVVREYRTTTFRVSEVDTVVDQVSLAAAKHDAVVQSAALYCQAQGVSMKEMMKEFEEFQRTSKVKEE